MNPLLKLICYAEKAIRVLAWLMRDWMTSPKLTFYFSSSKWEGSLRRFFKYTKHNLIFGDIKNAARHHPDFVVPLNMEDVFHLSSSPDSFPSNRLPVPNPEVIDLLNDKALFNDWLKTSKFSALALETVTAPPFILKPRIGQYGKGCEIVRDASDFEKNRLLIQSPDFICTEILSSQKEYATHLLVTQGTIRKCLCVEYIFASREPIKGIDSPQLVRLTRDSFLDTWIALMQEIRYSGICCVNYKIVHGRPKLMEINPRFGGSLTDYFFSFASELKDLQVKEPAIRDGQ